MGNCSLSTSALGAITCTSEAWETKNNLHSFDMLKKDTGTSDTREIHVASLMADRKIWRESVIAHLQVTK